MYLWPMVFQMMDDEMIIFRLLSFSSGTVMWDELKCEAAE